MDQYPGIERMDVQYSPTEISKPLTQANQQLKQAAVKFNQ